MRAAALVVAFATALLSAALLSAVPVAADGDGAPTAAATAAASTALDQAGAAHAWRGDLGELTVVDFAATWCVPCRRTLPRLQALHERHPGLNVLVVSVDATAAERDRLVADLDLDLPVLWDEGHRIAEHYRPEGMPATLVLDADGRVLHRHTGSGDADWDAFVELVERRLATAGAVR